MKKSHAKLIDKNELESPDTQFLELNESKLNSSLLGALNSSAALS